MVKEKNANIDYPMQGVEKEGGKSLTFILACLFIFILACFIIDH